VTAVGLIRVTFEITPMSAEMVNRLPWLVGNKKPFLVVVSQLRTERYTKHLELFVSRLAGRDVRTNADEYKKAREMRITRISIRRHLAAIHDNQSSRRILMRQQTRSAGSVRRPTYTLSVQRQIVNQNTNSSNRQVLRKLDLSEEGTERIYSKLTAEQRVLMVWPLTLTAWKFAKPNGFEPRLQRNVSRIERR
jgi:hypothetical protein